ncbi:MAG: putative pyrophosphohydrolase [Bacteroidetes bacterium]|jgi:predicted NUDIX family NTP pyrophosphohydrolase|nr:putative pyrophosphohydrolase [Bacteroidota bacterium]
MKQSAGILLYRIEERNLKVLLAHPGGPFWAKKDAGSWSIPKGEFTETEDALSAAKREFFEETGFEISGDCKTLTPIKQKSGKLVHAWAVEQDLDASMIKSNTFEMEWPPKSGKMQEFPEIDRAEWFSVGEAMEKILPAQRSFIEELMKLSENPI